MAYTVISVFPATVDTEEIRSALKNQGLSENDIVVSQSKFENDSSVDNYQDDEKTKSFWDHIFASDNEMLDAYSRESVGKVNIVVYTQNGEEAQRVQSFLNDSGAIEVKRKQLEIKTGEENSDTAGLPKDVYNGIIAKAKHDIYFLGSERVYHSNTVKGMDDSMDDLGSKD